MSFEVERFANHLLAGDQRAAWAEVMTSQQAGHNSLYIFDQVITKAMEHIGTLWEQNEITVADEHLATSVCDVVLTYCESLFLEAGQALAAKPAGRAMFFCLESERHYLGIKMVSLLFKQAGWEVQFLGPDLPLEYAITKAAKWKPDVIGISVSIAYHLPHLRAYIKALESLEQRPLVMVGGRMVNRYDLRPYGTDRTMFVFGLPQVQQWLQAYGEEEQVIKRATS